MADDFNPTRKDLQTLNEAILGIKGKKNTLVSRKISVQNKLGELNDLYKSVEYKSEEFNSIKSKRAELKLVVNQIELDIQALNEELNFKNKLKSEVEFFLKNNKVPEHAAEFDKFTLKVTALKKKYSEFATDRTRISSLRVMASEFIGDLEGLLK